MASTKADVVKIQTALETDSKPDIMQLLCLLEHPPPSIAVGPIGFRSTPKCSGCSAKSQIIKAMVLISGSLCSSWATWRFYLWWKQLFHSSSSPPISWLWGLCLELIIWNCGELIQIIRLADNYSTLFFWVNTRQLTELNQPTEGSGEQHR